MTIISSMAWFPSLHTRSYADHVAYRKMSTNVGGGLLVLIIIIIILNGELRSFRCGVRRSRWGGQPQHAPLGHRYLSGKPAQDRRVTGDEGRDFSGSTGGVFCRTLPDNQRRPERIR